MTRPALPLLLLLSNACASAPAPEPEEAHAPEPVVAPPPPASDAEAEPDEAPGPEPAPYAIADLEDRDYTCTAGAWGPRRPRATPAGTWSGGALVAKVTRSGPLDAEHDAAVEWSGVDARGAFSVRRPRVAWPANPGVAADGTIQVVAYAATRRAILVAEEPADGATRVMVIPATGPIVLVPTPPGAPFDPGAFQALPDGGLAMQWGSQVRDMIVVFEPDGRTRATRTFEWQVGGHGVLRSLTRLGDRVGLLVEEPGIAQSFLQFHDVDPAAPARQRFPLPRPLRLAPCGGPATGEVAAVVDQWLVPLLTTDDTPARLTPTLEVGSSGVCLRAVESWPIVEGVNGVQPSVLLRAADARTLSGVQDDGRRVRTLSCVLPGGAPAPSSSAAASTSGAACATVHIGLDLRALPTSSSTGGIDMFSRGEAWDFARRAPTGGAPEIRTTSGAGGFEATFRGAAPADVAARCQQTVAAYMPTAPRLPIIMEPAAQVIEACHPCGASP